MQDKASYEFGEIEVGGFKDYIVPTRRDRQKIRAAAWNHADHHGKKFSSNVIDGGIRVSRIS